MKIVATAILTHKDKILIAQRPEGKPLAGFWEFPGGKIEDGETTEQALQRELFEELNIKTNIGSFLMDSHYKYEHGEFLLRVHYVTISDIENLKPNHHQDYKWVKASEIGNFTFPEADIPIVNEIIKKEIA